MYITLANRGFSRRTGISDLLFLINFLNIPMEVQQRYSVGNEFQSCKVLGKNDCKNVVLRVAGNRGKVLRFVSPGWCISYERRN